MKSVRTRFIQRNANQRRRGFTLVEVLAALLFMAILLPVTVEAIRVASRAGQVGERKGTATRLAERVLNELLVTGGLVQNSNSGRIEEGERGYDWTMRSETWTEDRMNLVTVTVTFEVQGQQSDVKLATLFDPSQLTSETQ